jgi:hypothetical protein
LGAHGSGNVPVDGSGIETPLRKKCRGSSQDRCTIT